MRVSPSEYETVPECCKLSNKIKLYQNFKNHIKYMFIHSKKNLKKRTVSAFSSFSSILCP